MSSTGKEYLQTYLATDETGKIRRMYLPKEWEAVLCYIGIPLSGPNEWLNEKIDQWNTRAEALAASGDLRHANSSVSLETLAGSSAVPQVPVVRRRRGRPRKSLTSNRTPVPATAVAGPNSPANILPATTSLPQLSINANRNFPAPNTGVQPTVLNPGAFPMPRPTAQFMNPINNSHYQWQPQLSGPAASLTPSFGSNYYAQAAFRPFVSVPSGPAFNMTMAPVPLLNSAPSNARFQPAPAIYPTPYASRPSIMWGPNMSSHILQTHVPQNPSQANQPLPINLGMQNRSVPQLYPQGNLQMPTTLPGANISTPTDLNANTAPTIITRAPQPPAAPSAPAPASQPADDSPPQHSPYISPPTVSNVNTTPTTPTRASPPPDAAPPTPAPAPQQPAVGSLSRNSSPTLDPSDSDDFASLFGNSDDDETPRTLPAQTAAATGSENHTPSLSEWGDFSRLVDDWANEPDTAPGGIPSTMSNEAFAAMLFGGRDEGQ